MILIESSVNLNLIWVQSVLGVAVMWFRNKKVPEVRAGEVFRAQKAHRVVEIVEVIEPDAQISGMPHVRFRLSYMRPGDDEAILQGERTLALEAFAVNYPSACRLVAAE